jgi:predicted nucleotidyltransferase
MSTDSGTSDRRNHENTNAGLLLQHRDEILNSAYRHGARNVRVFGSVARGDCTANSDIDFLVEAGDSTSPWFPAGLVEELERLLRRHVDVVTEQSLHRLLRRRILKEAKPL